MTFGVIEDEHISKLVDHQYMFGETGRHTDEFVRFADENTILVAWINEDEIDEHFLNRKNYERISENYVIFENATDINGSLFKIIKIPLSRPL